MGKTLKLEENPSVMEETSKNDQKEKYFVWHIQGGLGKNIAATGLCKTIKETYPDRKLVIIASWPEVFLSNPYIDRVYALGQTPFFYEDFIEGKDVKICMHEPYNQTGHITKKKHLIENWCDLLGIKYSDQQPILFPNYSQKHAVNMWVRPRPIMVLQTSGGPMDGQHLPYSWTRDMPVEVAREVVSNFASQYHIIQITRPGGYQLEGVERIDQKMSNMELFALLAMSQKRVLIDSCLQHAAAALPVPSTVLWVGTSPTVFGYKTHTNIVAKLPKKASQLIGSYMFDYQFENNLHECPYMEVSDMFNISEILKAI